MKLSKIIQFFFNNKYLSTNPARSFITGSFMLSEVAPITANTVLNAREDEFGSIELKHD